MIRTHDLLPPNELNTADARICQDKARAGVSAFECFRSQKRVTIETIQEEQRVSGVTFSDFQAIVRLPFDRNCVRWALGLA